MKVSFTPQARDDLAAIREWIATDDERAADNVIARIVQAAIALGQFPMLGRAGAIEGTRELSVVGLPYVVVYQVAAGGVDVLTVVHARRKYPPD